MGPQTQVSLDYVFKIVGLCLTVTLFIAGIAIALIKMFYSDLKKSNDKLGSKIDTLITKLEPIAADVSILKIEIINMKEDHKELRDYVYEQAKWVGQHDASIQSINRELKSK